MLKLLISSRNKHNKNEWYLYFKFWNIISFVTYTILEPTGSFLMTVSSAICILCDKLNFLLGLLSFLGGRTLSPQKYNWSCSGQRLGTLNQDFNLQDTLTYIQPRENHSLQGLTLLWLLTTSLQHYEPPTNSSVYTFSQDHWYRADNPFYHLFQCPWVFLQLDPTLPKL